MDSELRQVEEFRRTETGTEFAGLLRKGGFNIEVANSELKLTKAIDGGKLVIEVKTEPTPPAEDQVHFFFSSPFLMLGKPI